MSDDLIKELRSYPRHYEAAHKAAEEIERLRAENERLRAREASLREVLNQYSCGCSSPCWYPKDSPSCGLKARTALEEEEKAGELIGVAARVNKRATAARCRAALGKEKK